MLQTEALVIQREVLAADYERLTLHLPALAARARPGHLIAVRTGRSPWEPLLRVPFALASADAAGTISVLLPPGAPDVPSHRPGESVDVLGPVGSGWQIDEQARNVVLVGTEMAIGALLFLAEVAVRRGLNVALLIGAATDHPALPSVLVPPAVEYEFARGPDGAAAALDLVSPDLLRWADALYTTLPLPQYPALAQRIRATRMRWEPSFARGLLLPPMACYVGICDACWVVEARKPWRACLDGPQCDVRDFVH